jgi:hypothetical protein
MHLVHQARHDPPRTTAIVVGVIMAATRRCVTVAREVFPHLELAAAPASQQFSGERRQLARQITPR